MWSGLSRGKYFNVSRGGHREHGDFSLTRKTQKTQRAYAVETSQCGVWVGPSLHVSRVSHVLLNISVRYPRYVETSQEEVTSELSERLNFRTIR